tara:strand:+ start:17 stop:1855 length:1839 start_codon:yes stop_codon:yes gene_type:complete
MAVNLSPVGGVAAQFFTNTGAVLTGGKLYTYLAGTTTPATTYTTSAGNVARTNPIILDSAGRVPDGGEIWITNNIGYKFLLKDSNDVLIATYDNIFGGLTAFQVTYEAPYANSVETTVGAVLARTVNAADFGMSESASAATNAAAIMSAIAALDAGIGKTGGVVYLPKGKFNVASDVVSLVGVTNVTLQGDGNANAYEGSDAGTQLTFTAGTVCIDVNDAAGVGSASAYNTITNIYINGDNVVTYGLRVRGRTNVSNMFAYQCTIGFEVVDYGNQTLFETSTAFANDIGFQITGYSTSKVTVNNCNFRQNDIGVNLLAGYHIWFQGCVIESNNQEGLRIYKANAAPAFAPRNITIFNCFFENNGASNPALYAITIDAETPSYSARRVSFIGNYFAEDKLVNINDVSINVWQNNVYGSACVSTTGPTVSEVIFEDIDPALLGITFTAAQRSGYNVIKETGQGGFRSDLAFYTQGGRTQTLWFTNIAALSAGVETVLRPLSAGTFTPALLTYPVYGQGCVVGIVAQAQTNITTGSLKFKAYATLGWGGTRYTYGLELDVLNGTARNTVTADVEDYPIPYLGNYNYNNLGLVVTPSAAPAYVGPNDLMVGLVIAY